MVRVFIPMQLCPSDLRRVILFFLIYKMKWLDGILLRSLPTQGFFFFLSWVMVSGGKEFLDKRTFRHLLICAVQMPCYYM